MRTLSYFAYLVLLALAVALPMSIAEASRPPRIYIRRHQPETTELVQTPKAREIMGWKSVVCIPKTSSVLEDHEGRHKCAYDHPNGYRAVAVGYNLDDNVDTRKSELTAAFLDYDKVYSGEQCLWEVQMTALLTFDARRALSRASEVVDLLDDFCCELQAVFADVQHSASKALSGRDLKGFVEKASVGEWNFAARELKSSAWCFQNEQRCEDNIAYVEDGCDNMFNAW